MNPQVTIDLFKKEAKRIKKEKGITHSEALDQISKSLGFNNYRQVINEAESMTEEFLEIFPQLREWQRARKINTPDCPTILKE